MCKGIPISTCSCFSCFGKRSSGHSVDSRTHSLQNPKNTMSILQQIKNQYPTPEKLCMKDPDNVEQKLQNLVGKGLGNLQVITDFDYTLTKFKTSDGVVCQSCHAIMDQSPLMSESFRQRLADLRAKYYPIEIDHELTMAEKLPYMVEWYTKSHEALAETGIDKKQIEEMVRISKALLRDEVDEVLTILDALDIPVLIFSAGVGDALEAVLRRDKVLHPNITVVSNYMEFDNETGKIKGFKDPVIHMFNKNEEVLENFAYPEELKKRPNALVLGDSLGDSQMDHGMRAEGGCVLKIGFLNDNIKERYDEFINNFDIVLLDDQTFRLPKLIVEQIAGKPPASLYNGTIGME